MHVCCNNYFGQGAIKLKDHKDKVLRKMHETKIAKELRVRSNFLRAALYSRENATWIGLIMPKTAVSTLACKINIENSRANTKIIKIINQEDSVTIECEMKYKEK